MLVIYLPISLRAVHKFRLKQQVALLIIPIFWSLFGISSFWSNVFQSVLEITPTSEVTINTTPYYDNNGEERTLEGEISSPIEGINGNSTSLQGITQVATLETRVSHIVFTVPPRLNRFLSPTIIPTPNNANTTIITPRVNVPPLNTPTLGRWIAPKSTNTPTSTITPTPVKWVAAGTPFLKPSAPSNLNVTYTHFWHGYDIISLSWQDNSDNEDSFYVTLSEGHIRGGYVAANTTSVGSMVNCNQSSFGLETLVHASVKAINEFGESNTILWSGIINFCQ